MPTDDQGRYFMTDENIPRRRHYKVINWIRETEWPKRRKRIKESDLPSVDFMTLEVIQDEKPTSVSYITLYGPFEDWEYVEGILGYDYGDEGSRYIPARAA